MNLLICNEFTISKQPCTMKEKKDGVVNVV